MGRLDGKIAVITGAGTGVGRACMEIFAREGATVVGAARRKEKLDEALASVTKAGGKGMVVPTNVADDAACKALIDATVSEYGRIDIVVNNAGVGYSDEDSHPQGMAGLAETPTEYWEDVIDINLNSVYYMSKYAIAAMRKSGGGAIVNVSSIGGVNGMADAHAYAAAKAGMNNLTRSMATTYGAENIRTNCVAPGGIDTEMVRSKMKSLGDPWKNDEMRFMMSPMGRIGTPQEMANGCLFLASDEASYVNGAILVIDGGSSAHI